MALHCRRRYIIAFLFFFFYYSLRECEGVKAKGVPDILFRSTKIVPGNVCFEWQEASVLLLYLLENIVESRQTNECQL